MTSGLRIEFNNLDLIPTSPVHDMDSAKNLQPRILYAPNVVVVNSQNKMIMSELVKGKDD